MARRRSVPPTVNRARHHDRKGDPMDVDDDDDDGYGSDGTASKSSEETDLTDPADYGEDSEGDASDLAGLLADDEHPPEHYMEMMADTNGSLLQYNEYAANSLKLLDRIEQEWFKFCAYLKREPKDMYQRMDVQMLYAFFSWVLNQRRGKGGRRRQGLKYQSSLDTYWKIFRLVYEREVQEKIDRETSLRVIKNVIPKLAKQYHLKKGRRKKSVVYLDDLVKVVETTVTTTKKKFGHGRQRILLCLFFQLAGFSANRPQALLNLCYRHIKITLLKDPAGGPNNILIEFTVEFAKTFLGEKEETTFIVPEIIFDPSLVLSPHVVLLGLLFADRAFAPLDGERVLTSARQLIDLKIPDDTYQIELHLDPALNEVPVFRRSERTMERIEISATEALTYSTIRPWIRRVGELSAFRDIVRPYSLRYGAGKALDNSGHVSEAVRSLIFQHSDPRTFLKYYLHRKVDKDVRAIVQGLDPQEHIMRAACRMLRSVNPRRPQELTTEQSRSVNRQPHIQELIQKRDLLSGRLGRPLKKQKGTVQYELHKKISRELVGARQRARDNLLLDVQEKFDFEEPLREIKRQLSGIKVAKTFSGCVNTNETVSPPQQRLITALLTLPCETLWDEMLRRTEGIDAVAAYCLFEEGDTCRQPHDKRPTAQALQKVRVEVHVPPPPNQREIASAAVMNVRRPLYCFICLDKFSTHGGVTKHLGRKHLQHIKPGDMIRCPRCDDVVLKSKMDLQSHAYHVHSTVSPEDL
ncbi:C2H2 finger domain-containing protein [Histoplasma capsulatum var. duboisii H88]|uniref:C2H2 finger domain-containing protein n=1 Tax=Ajellomyces capsulatus (strain H88) TaxID=544711 RepID=F0UNT4_AJEC8|nr:C2H2 finger domain-containing protein [Histoplasma capsulatum var. duboisii H88]QSS53009.1 C2H2 finger domain-containing protein [Histoplasma capsulatum var. duboisii H88]